MSQHHPQQPGQPGYGYPHHPGPYNPQQPWGAPPQPPKKNKAGKIIGLGCAGFLAVITLFGIIGAIASSSDSSSAPATAATQDDKPAAADKPATKPKKKVVTFKVWGTAPAGVLGPLDITYGSDSDNRDGKWKNGTFTATLPFDDDAMWYDITAQLQGSGDIQCSVTVDGHTENGHASGSYNVCSAQVNAGLFGGWD